MDWSSLLAGALVAIISGGIGAGAAWALAAKNDSRQRWWDALLWVWDNRDLLPPKTKVELLDALNDLSQTKEQSAMLEAVMDALFASGGSQS